MVSSDAASEEQVLIAGAGPTGLALANSLAHHRIPFMIIDKKSGPSSESKGLALNLGTQYGLAQIGLRGTVGKRGCGIRRLRVSWQGRRFAAIDFRWLDLPLQSLITQPQSVTERELCVAVEEHGRHVSWNTRLVEIAPSSHAVDAVIQSDGEASLRRRFAYVVGCEGKGSVVRAGIGAHSSGSDYPMHFVLGDFRSDRFPEDEACYHVYPDRFFVVVPIGGGVWRFVVSYAGPEPDAAPTARDIEDVVERYLGPGAVKGAPLWLSRAPFYMRTTDRLRRGRAFIAGDAAHLFSPIGGTGMNTGVQDALNLGWKLALHFRGAAGDAIFDAYERERLDVIQHTALATDASTRAIAGGFESPIVRALAPVMANRRNLRALYPKLHAGLAPRYASCYAEYDVTGLRGALRVGELCIARDRLVQLAGARDPAILIVARVDELGPAASEVSDLARLAARYPAIAPALLFVGSVAPDRLQRLGASGRALVVPVHDLPAHSGLVPGAVLVLSPDAYVVFSGTLMDMDRLEAALRRVFALRPLGDAIQEVAAC